MRFKRQFRGIRGKRRIRGSNGTWFPILGSSWSNEGNTFDDVSFNLQTGNALTDKSLGTNVVTIPVTRDYTPINQASSDAINNLPTLRDFTEGQDYILKRIVGNIDAFVVSQSNPTLPWSSNDFWSYIKVAAGFFVARADDLDQSLPDLTREEIDPMDSKNSQNPWIWRRVWILGNPAMREPVGAGAVTTDGISTTRGFGPSDRANGIDSKVKRRIRREERLWFSLSMVGWNGVQATVASNDQPQVNANLDIRIFGKMVKGRNSSTF